MSLSSYRIHRIYLAATMNYGLGSDDPEELAYYNQIKKEMDDMKKKPVKKGSPESLHYHLSQNYKPTWHIAQSKRSFYRINLALGSDGCSSK